MNVRPCPECGYPVSRLGVDLGPMRCLRCDTVFTPPGEERVSSKAIVPLQLTPDVDATSYSLPHLSLDLSGNYRTDVLAWVEEAWAHFWWFCFLPLLMAIPFFFLGTIFAAPVHFLLGNGALVLLFLVLRPLWFSGCFLVALRGMRDHAKSFEMFWEPFLDPRLLVANLVPSVLWGVLLGGILYWLSYPVPLSEMLLLAAAIGLFLVAFYVHVRLWFVHMLLLDARLTLMESLQASWTLTRHHVFGLSMYLLLLSAILILGASFFCVGLVPAMAFVTLAEASAYLHATGQIRVQRTRVNP